MITASTEVVPSGESHVEGAVLFNYLVYSYSTGTACSHYTRNGSIYDPSSTILIFLLESIYSHLAAPVTLSAMPLLLFPVLLGARSNKAGLQFPVARIGRYLKRGKYASRVGAGAPVYLAAVLEYLCLLYTSPSPRDQRGSRMPSSA